MVLHFTYIVFQRKNPRSIKLTPELKALEHDFLNKYYSSLWEAPDSYIFFILAEDIIRENWQKNENNWINILKYFRSLCSKEIFFPTIDI